MENKTVVITQKDCNCCRYWSTCAGLMVFRAFPSLETMTFGDQGCPRDWHLKETQDLAKEVDNSSSTITTPTL
jgi:hypothetical protein